MRYEAVWLVRFIVTTSFLLGVFVAGYTMGKRRATRWNRIRGSVSHGERGVSGSAFVGSMRGRSDLFAPEVLRRTDHRAGDHASILELPRASPVGGRGG